MRYRFIGVERTNYPITILCRVLQVSSSGYYAFMARGPSARALANEELLAEIKEIHVESRGTYGSPRMYRELIAKGRVVSPGRVERLMRNNEITARRKRRFKVTTDSKHNMPVADNTLDRGFAVERPDRKWAGDITYIWTREGWLFLAVILDLFSRRVVGWAMDHRIDRRLVLSALDMALTVRRPSEQLLHHSDRGSQYASKDYRSRLEDAGITCSMSRKGDCWDNAVVESFFGTLKQELVHRNDFETRAEARSAIFEYIEVFYNRWRRQSYLGYMSPAEFEAAALTAALAA
jgi:transposase InsO family protein